MQAVATAPSSFMSTNASAIRDLRRLTGSSVYWESVPLTIPVRTRRLLARQALHAVARRFRCGRVCNGVLMAPSRSLRWLNIQPCLELVSSVPVIAASGEVPGSRQSERTAIIGAGYGPWRHTEALIYWQPAVTPPSRAWFVSAHVHPSFWKDCAGGCRGSSGWSMAGRRLTILSSLLWIAGGRL